MSLVFFLKKLARKKVLSQEETSQTDLRRCLTTFDLTLLGIGCTLGAGLYVLSGQVAHQKAGPAVVLSFLVAAIASAFAGLCYAEFAARIPRAGSAYVYSYVTVGEFMAFIIGWNLVLEYVIGTASVARGWSGYMDSLVDKKISTFFNSTMPIRVNQFSDYPDFFAFGMTILVTAVLAIGVKESSLVNNIFTILNLLVIVYIVICGCFKLDLDNWNLDKDKIPSNAGNGGFMPYGFSGVMAGAATCFYGFVGFDVVATTGEETKNPQRSIPIAIVLSLLVIFLSYLGVSAIITLMCPYYLLDEDAPLPFVFKRAGWGVARYVISVGAISGLSASLLGAMFPLPRVLYAMGSDGTIFHFMGKVSPRFQTPLLGTAISGIFSGLMAMLFNLEELVNMMSIGTLLAYTLVALSVLILRYQPDEQEMSMMVFQASHFTIKGLFTPEHSQPTQLSSISTKITIAIMCLFIICFSSILVLCDDYLEAFVPWAIFLAVLLFIPIAICLVILVCQHQSSSELAFKVPFLPFLPVLSSFINIYLMLKLPVMTWVRFSVWMVVGFVIYFLAGILHFHEDKSRNGYLNLAHHSTGTPCITQKSHKDKEETSLNNSNFHDNDIY